jgi:glycosyltransferase involved in cell wall biosynthesis
MSDVPVISITRGDTRRPLVFSWGVSSFYGWGVYGLNLMLYLAQHQAVVPVSAIDFGPGDVVLDPERERLMRLALRSSTPLWKALRDLEGDRAEVDHMFLQGLGNDLVATTSAYDRKLYGRPTIGVVFLEQATLSPQGRARAKRFETIIAGSSWNEEVLRRQGIQSVQTVLQGVDTAIYYPAARRGWFPGRFVVFSGGKLEYRKGQDLVLAAFRAFHQRHPEALLLMAWHSPWTTSSSLRFGHTEIEPPPSDAEGKPDMAGWAIANGIPADAVIAVPPTPNIAMANLVREADVALFPNRCEGGTNLVAMECLACGVPTILSANTGHLDLLQHDIALPLKRQGQPAATDLDTTDWGESDVDEMLEALETVWRDRDTATAMGERAVRCMATMNWPAQLDMLLSAVMPHMDDG